MEEVEVHFLKKRIGYILDDREVVGEGFATAMPENATKGHRNCLYKLTFSRLK